MRPAMLMVVLLGFALLLASCSVKTSFKAGDTSSTDESKASAEGGKAGGDEATSGPHTTAMRVGDAYDEEKQQVSNELSEFATDAPEVHMDADLAGLTKGAKIKATLIAVSVIDTEGNLIQNQEVNSVEWEAPDAEPGVHATFTAPDKGWPKGEYVIELSVDDQKVDEAEFMVKGEEGLNEPRTP